MSELKCNCGRVTHTGLGCGPDLPRTPYDRQDGLTRLRAENERLWAAVKAADRVYLELEWLLEMSRPCIGNTNVEVVRHWVGVYEKAKAALAGEEQENASSQT